MNLPRRIHSAPSPAHPSEETLLLFLDGELPSRQAPAIRAHLHRCWDCRAKAEKFQKGIYAFVDYAEQRVLPQAGEPPNEWRGFAPLLDRAAAASLEHPGWLTRYRQRWMTVATAAILAIVFVLWPMSAPPALSAKEFLAHARSSRRIATFSKRRIRIHVNGRQAGGAAIRSAFTEAKLDWSDPLNPDRFAAWHASVKAPIDRLTKSDRSVTLATSANEGLIREASFTLDAGDWHPTDESLRFGSGMNVEISEVTDTN